MGATAGEPGLSEVAPEGLVGVAWVTGSAIPAIATTPIDREMSRFHEYPG